MDFDVELPRDLAVEAAALAAIIVQPERFAEVAGVLAPGLMFRDAHRLILECAHAVHAAGGTPDFLALRSELERRGHVERVGGVEYLSTLVDSIPRGTDVPQLARRLNELAQARDVVRALNLTAREVAANGATADTIGPLVAALQSAEAPFDLGIAHERRVAAEAERERARRAARRLVDAEETERQDIPPIESLSALLTRPDDAPALPRIQDWQPHGARVLLAALRKTGKTTMLGNYARCLVDADLWLGAYPVRKVRGSLVILDAEMQRRQLSSWTRDQRIRNTDAVHIVSLRGRVAAFNILSPACRQQWAAAFREIGTEVLVLDCLRPFLDALGLDENRDAGKFLAAFDALLAEAGVLESVVVHHFGHTGERSRGDSRIEDQADAIWKLVRQDDDPRSQRFISAYGRDIDVREQALDYDPATRRLSVAGGSRKDAASQGVVDAILGLLADVGRPMNGQEIKRHFEGEHGRNTIDEALKAGKTSGVLTCHTGPKASNLWSPCQLPPGSRELPGNLASSFPPSIGRRETGKLETDDQASGGERVRI